MIRRWWVKIRKQGLGVSRTRRGVSYADPLHAGRHPFQTYLLALCVVSGVPLVLGVATPNSIRNSLPEWLVFAWGYFLLVGALTALVGSYWPGGYANALTIERIGLALVGSAALIFGVVILVAVGLGGLVSSAITLAFGASCIRRARDIGHIIQVAIANTPTGG